MSNKEKCITAIICVSWQSGPQLPTKQEQWPIGCFLYNGSWLVQSRLPLGHHFGFPLCLSRKSSKESDPWDIQKRIIKKIIQVKKPQNLKRLLSQQQTATTLLAVMQEQVYEARSVALQDKKTEGAGLCQGSGSNSWTWGGRDYRSIKLSQSNKSGVYPNISGWSFSL